MTILDRLRHLVTDPPPRHVFEFSNAGIAWAVPGAGHSGIETGFTPLPSGVLEASPLKDNILDTGALTAALRNIAPVSANSKKRRPCVVILPDFCARLAVLDFEHFPKKVEEQAPLVRFRVKKTMPFDIESAAIQFHAQPGGHVVVVAVSLEILARYEQLMRALEFHPGLVTLATLAALDGIVPSPGFTVYTRVAGRILSLSAVENGVLRLTRTVELTSDSEEEVASVVDPTVAFLEDEFGAKGVKSVRMAHQNDAGLQGYLASCRSVEAAA